MKIRISKKIELNIRSFIKKEDLLKRGDTLIVGVSAGPDSMALLFLLSKWMKSENWKIKVAYVDHGLRRAAKEEKECVEKISKQLGVDFVWGYKNTRLLQRQQKLSLEEAARKLRYEFLRKEANKYTSAKIVLAHHLNDQVETFFVNVLKGSGLGGLSGMKAKEGNIIRPLLQVSKKEILQYIKEKKISYCMDASNQDVSMLRNQVRHRLLPYIKKHFRWNLYKTLPRMMSVLKDEHEFIEEWMNAYDPLPKTKEHRVSVPTFIAWPEAIQRRFIKKILDAMSTQRNYSSFHIEAARELFFNPVSNKKLLLPEGIVAKKLKREVVWSKRL